VSLTIEEWGLCGGIALSIVFSRDPVVYKGIKILYY
jgi:hypothetical protein